MKYPEAHGVSETTARDHMRLYRDTSQLPVRQHTKTLIKAPSLPSAPVNMEDLESMTKEQLIQELVKARITESRLEKQSFSGLHIVRAIRSGTTAGCLSMGDAKRDEADDRDQGGHDAHGPRPGSPVAEPADGPKDAGRDGNNEPQKCDGAE